MTFKVLFFLLSFYLIPSPISFVNCVLLPFCSVSILKKKHAWLHLAHCFCATSYKENTELKTLTESYKCQMKYMSPHKKEPKILVMEALWFPFPFFTTHTFMQPSLSGCGWKVLNWNRNIGDVFTLFHKNWLVPKLCRKKHLSMSVLYK